MEIAIMYITLGFLYTIACVMDGPDVKPLWKKWLGVKLANVANSYYPINHCKKKDCFFVNDYLAAQDKLEKLEESIEALKEGLPLFKEPFIESTVFDNVKLESGFEVPEWEVMNCICESKKAIALGYPANMLPRHLNIDFKIENAKQKVMNGIFETIKREKLVNIEVDKESRCPAIIVRGWMYAGRNR